MTMSYNKDHLKCKYVSKCNCKPNKNVNPNLECECICKSGYGIYSKGLPHDKNGFVSISELEKYLTALNKQSVFLLNKVAKGGTLKQTDPISAWSNDVPCLLTCDKLPKLCSNRYATQLLEVYAMFLARDKVFKEYDNDGVISDIITHMKTLDKYEGLKPITANTLFRGSGNGVIDGPYISQFLYKDYKEGGIIYDQKYEPYSLKDYMKTMNTAVSAQNGIITETFIAKLPKRYIITGRDLATYVHLDEPYLLFYRTALVLFKEQYDMNPGIPINTNNAPFNNYGKVDVLTSLGTVTRLALLSAWCIKNRTVFLRPEAGGIILERKRLDIEECKNPELSDIIENPLLEMVKDITGNYLLPQVYVEGSPTHPSWVSGHATISGACITILKFFFDGNSNITLYEPDITGSYLVPTDGTSTVSKELNKLASNCGLGRNWAGIHYRMDMHDGILLGERVALKFLKEHICNYPQKFKVKLKLYSGEEVCISSECNQKFSGIEWD